MSLTLDGAIEIFAKRYQPSPVSFIRWGKLHGRSVFKYAPPTFITGPQPRRIASTGMTALDIGILGPHFLHLFDLEVSNACQKAIRSTIS
jgi:hypothetical protein